MKVALLHYTAPPVVGGVESVLGHHARLMALNGHQVKILAGRGSQVDAHVEFVTLPLADSLHPEILAVKQLLDAGQVPDEFKSLVAMIRQQLETTLAGVNVLIAHNVCSLNKNLPLTTALKEYIEKPGAPRLIQWHHDLAWTTPRYRAELHEGYPWDLLCTAWKNATQVVVSSARRKELAELQHSPLDSITVIPNGVDIGKFYKLEEETMTLIARLRLFESAPILLLPVRITPRKNIELALQTLAVLRRRFPSAALVVTGPLGPHNPGNRTYFNRLQTLRQELGLVGAAHFLAELADQYLPDQIIADFYRVSDALLLPSQEEGFGIPVLEAGLAGLPIFCSDIPPLHDLAGEYATYFPAGAGPIDVADLIANQLSTNLSFHLRGKVRQEYTWDRIYFERLEPLLRAEMVGVQSGEWTSTPDFPDGRRPV
jgi:glycosyltransferase involved in cell wall biosynthesis